MITKFDSFDTQEEITFMLNTLLEYYNGSYTKIKKFLTDLLIPGTNVKFYSKYSFNNIKKVLVDYENKHNGIISKVERCGIGYTGTAKKRVKEFVSLDLILKNDEHIIHSVDVNSPFTIYGYIPPRKKDIINKLILIENAKKFNL